MTVLLRVGISASVQNLSTLAAPPNSMGSTSPSGALPGAGLDDALASWPNLFDAAGIVRLEAWLAHSGLVVARPPPASAKTERDGPERDGPWQIVAVVVAALLLAAVGVICTASGRLADGCV